MLVSQQRIRAQQSLWVNLHHRREVHHNPARGQRDSLSAPLRGNFALQENQLRFGDGGGVGGDEGGVDKRIGSRHHDDGVFALPIHSDDGEARDLVGAGNMFKVHAAGLKVAHGGRRISVAAHRAHKGDRRAQQCGRHRLVSSFATRSNLTAVAQQCFARLRMPCGVDHEVSVDGPDYAHAHADQYAR